MLACHVSHTFDAHRIRNNEAQHCDLTQTNTSFANNPCYKPKNLPVIASNLLLKQGEKKLQYYRPLLFKCPGRGFPTFLFPTTNESFMSLPSSRICITATASPQWMTTWYSFGSPSVDGRGSLVTKDEEKAKVLNAALASVFNSQTSTLRVLGPLRTRD